MSKVFRKERGCSETGAGAGEETGLTGPPSNCLLLSGVREGSLVNPSPIFTPIMRLGYFIASAGPLFQASIWDHFPRTQPC